MLQRVEKLPSQDRNTASAGAAFARFELFRDIAAVEPLWRAFEQHADFTPYQGFDFLSLWQKHIGAHEGVGPLIAVAFGESGEPLCLLPLGKFASGRFTVARFLAGKHANYNFGLWRKGISFPRQFIEQLANEIAKSAPEIALLDLHNQPFSWHGVENPLLVLSHQLSPAVGYRLKLGGSGEEVLARQVSVSQRKRLRGRQRKLEKLEGYRYFVPSTPDEVTRCLDAFFEQKRAYLDSLKIPNPFADENVQAFLRAVCLKGIDTGKAVFEIHALEGGGEILSLYAGVADERRLSAAISSYTSSENGRLSPGSVTIQHMVLNTAERGLAMLDLGVGEADYKFAFCNETEDLFDSFIPLSSAGHAIVPLLRAQAGLKRFIKSSPVLWRAAKTVRGLLPR